LTDRASLACLSTDDTIRVAHRLRIAIQTLLRLQKVVTVHRKEKKKKHQKKTHPRMKKRPILEPQRNADDATLNSQLLPPPFADPLPPLPRNVPDHLAQRRQHPEPRSVDALRRKTLLQRLTIPFLLSSPLHSSHPSPLHSNARKLYSTSRQLQRTSLVETNNVLEFDNS